MVTTAGLSLLISEATLRISIRTRLMRFLVSSKARD